MLILMAIFTYMIYSLFDFIVLYFLFVHSLGSFDGVIIANAFRLNASTSGQGALIAGHMSDSLAIRLAGFHGYARTKDALTEILRTMQRDGYLPTYDA